MPIRAPVAAINIVRTQRDHEQHDRNFDDYDAGVEPRALLDADHQNCRDHQGDDERRKVKADFRPKQVRRTQKLMRPLQQFGRLRAHDRADSIEKGLGARHQ